MSRLETSYQFFSKQGVKFLVIELLVVFLGVYGAFLFQNYSENRKIELETEKTLIGLKEDLEYFRVFFPGSSASQYSDVGRWTEMYSDNNYFNYSEWRFIQPQYNYTVLEYALNTDAQIVDFELYSILSSIYRELQKLRHTEELMTQLAMSYQAFPEGLPSSSETLKTIHAGNLNNFLLFIERGDDRASIMQRIAEYSEESLEIINESFSPTQLRQIEITLIREQLSTYPEEQRAGLRSFIQQSFPDLTESDMDLIFE